MKLKRTEIVVELDEVLIIRRRQSIGWAWCGACREQVQMLMPDEAAMVVGISSRVIYQWVESGKIHFSETSEGRMLICQNSLPNLLKHIEDFDR